MLKPRPSTFSFAPFFALFVLVLSGAFSPQSSFSQVPSALDPIEEEELDDQALEQVPTSESVDRTELEALYERALTLFPESAIPLLGQLIDQLEGELADAHDDSLQQLLARSLARRAELSAEFGDLDNAASDIDRLLAASPSFEFPDDPSDPVPEALREMLERQRSHRVGTLTLTGIEPPDAELWIDGRPREVVDGKISLLAGIRSIELRRPGYEPYLDESLQIRAGRTTELKDIELLRQSAVITVQTRPAQAEVWIDGELRGTTSDAVTTDVQTAGLTAVQPGQAFSKILTVAPVELGLHLLEVRKPGYRSYRAEVRVGELLDYQMPPVVLEPESGVLIFKGMPKNATLEIDGVPRPVDDPSAPVPRVTLSPGDYSIRIAESGSRVFASRLRLADRQTIEVNVRLRPGFVLLGVLGDDERRTADLSAGFASALGKSDRWAVIEQAEAARNLLPAVGLTRQSLQAAAAAEGAPSIDWSAAQTKIHQQIPGLLYALAVLNDDLVSSRADLWIWAAPPAPSQPDLLKLNLGEIQDLTELTQTFEQRLHLRRPWVGALVVDSGVTPHPVIAHVSPESPAAKAGLRPGDQVVAVAQVPIFKRKDYDQRIAVAEPGEPIEIGLQTPSDPRTVKLTLGSSPLALADLGDLPAAIAFTDLRLRTEQQDVDDRWLLELNQALISLRAGDRETAVRQLSQIKAPASSSGLGQAAIDYWLGTTLLKLGSSYDATAAEALTRAAKAQDARLFHNDGPWVAPRARTRLQNLENSSRSP